MLKLIEGFPEDVVAIAGSGRVTAADYDQVLIPAVEAAFASRGRVRCYYELGKEFSGIEAEAAWKDFRIGLEHFSGWERMAVVTDVDWIRLALNAFGFLMAGRLKVFPTARADEARDWVTEAVAA